MSLLQFVIIVSAVIFVLFGLDLYKRKKATMLHFLIFFGGGTILVLFAVSTPLLNKFGGLFGLARGADVIVYISIILLFYLFIDLHNKHTRDVIYLSALISQLAIDESYQDYHACILNYKNTQPQDKYIFFIRAYNESQSIGIVIDEIIKDGYKKIIIVNDGSSDTTGDIIAAKQKQYPQALILLIEHSLNRGAGCATKTGLSFIRKYSTELQIDRVVGFDADGQMDVHDMKAFRQMIQHYPADLYLGSRFINGGKGHNMPGMRKYILWISRVVTRLFYGTKTSDPHNGFRVISMHTVQQLHISADGMHYANEINEQIKKNKLSFVEVPVNIRYTDYSLTKGQKNSNSIKIAIEMIYKKLFFR